MAMCPYAISVTPMRRVTMRPYAISAAAVGCTRCGRCPASPLLPAKSWHVIDGSVPTGHGVEEPKGVSYCWTANS